MKKMSQSEGISKAKLKQGKIKTASTEKADFLFYFKQFYPQYFEKKNDSNIMDYSQIATDFL